MRYIQVAQERRELALKMRREGLTFQAIADHFGFSHARAYQIVAHALRVEKRRLEDLEPNEGKESA